MTSQFVFDRFALDPVRRRLTGSGEPMAMSDRQLDVLLLLVARAGQIVAKDDLLTAGWKDVAVGDNSLEQIISSLRKLLGPRVVETVPRRGYRFAAPVQRATRRETDAGIEGLLSPHRAFIEGRAALESLEADRVARARAAFEEALAAIPEGLAAAHLGLATACVLQFEMTRADPTPDAAALAVAIHHSREACRLSPESGEAWATLGFVCDRMGARLDALAASQRAVALEPDNWRHHFRLAYVGWGEERLRAARHTLALLPNLPLAHWLAATVHVARQALPEAERELRSAIAAQTGETQGRARFSSVALHWLLGLLHLSHGDEGRALAEFELELSLERAGHLYARECCANTWYAIGALRLRQGRPADAERAFRHALERVAAHPMACMGLASLGVPAIVPPEGSGARLGPGADRTRSVEAALARGAQLVGSGADVEAARLLDEALATASPGNAGWLLPVEPLLHVSARPDIWVLPLARLRSRAA